jgi:sugar phosphate permease
MFSYWFLTPQAMQNNLNFSTLTVGLAFIPMSIPQFISGMKSADLSARFGNTKVLLIGLALSLIGLLIPTFINIHYGYWLVVALPMILLGFGQGLALSPLTVAGVAHTGPDVAGAASGVVNTTHQIGASVGLSLVIAITSGIKSPDILYQHAMFIDSGLVAIALIVVVIIIYPVSRQED